MADQNYYTALQHKLGSIIWGSQCCCGGGSGGEVHVLERKRIGRNSVSPYAKLTQDFRLSLP